MRFIAAVLPSEGARKLVRGGSWDENRENLRSSFHNVKLPDSGDGVYSSIGFRCVYDKQMYVIKREK